MRKTLWPDLCLEILVVSLFGVVSNTQLKNEKVIVIMFFGQCHFRQMACLVQRVVKLYRI